MGSRLTTSAPGMERLPFWLFLTTHVWTYILRSCKYYCDFFFLKHCMVLDPFSISIQSFYFYTLYCFQMRLVFSMQAVCFHIPRLCLSSSLSCLCCYLSNFLSFFKASEASLNPPFRNDPFLLCHNSSLFSLMTFLQLVLNDHILCLFLIYSITPLENWG